MSPSEHDLRASLHQGAGEPIDVDRIVAAGAAARAQRRTRLAGAAAAAVVVVAAASVTGVVLARDDTGTTTADGGGSYEQSRTGNGAAIAPGEPAPSSSPSASSSGTAAESRAPVPPALCPASFPQRSLPGGSSGGALFDRPAASITVCSYGTPLTSASGARPAGLTLTGTTAVELQRSLENARSTPSTPCTTVRPATQRNLAFVAVDAAGQQLRVVTTTLSIPICDTRTTNGVTVRYGWVPPLGLRQQLYALTPTGAPASLPSRLPSGKNIGTPAR